MFLIQEEIINKATALIGIILRSFRYHKYGQKRLSFQRRRKKMFELGGKRGSAHETPTTGY